MANPTNFPGDINVPGNARITGAIIPALTRSEVLAVETRERALPLVIWRKHDDYAAVLPNTPSSDDLGLVAGTFGSASPTLQSVDFGGTTTTAYARAQIEVPDNYVAGQSFVIRFHAGAHTTISDDDMTLDLEVYRSDEEIGIGSDLASAASANNINSTTDADVDFTITAASLNPGDVLDVRIKVTGTDAGDAGADIRAQIGSVKLVYGGR